MRLNGMREPLMGSPHFIITSRFPPEVQASLPGSDPHYPILSGLVNQLDYQERRVVSDRESLMRCEPREVCSRRIEYNDNGNCVSTESSPSEFATENFGDANQVFNSPEQFKLVGSFMRTGVTLRSLSRISGADELLARYECLETHRSRLNGNQLTRTAPDISPSPGRHPGCNWPQSVAKSSHPVSLLG